VGNDLATLIHFIPLCAIDFHLKVRNSTASHKPEIKTKNNRQSFAWGCGRPMACDSAIGQVIEIAGITE
jgi:hypothetical protein